MDKRDTFVAKLKAQLDVWNAEIDQLDAGAHKKQAGFQGTYFVNIAVLRKYRDDAQQRMEEIQRATGIVWEEKKTGIDESWDSINQAFQKACAHFGK